MKSIATIAASLMLFGISAAYADVSTDTASSMPVKMSEVQLDEVTAAGGYYKGHDKYKGHHKHKGYEKHKGHGKYKGPKAKDPKHKGPKAKGPQHKVAVPKPAYKNANSAVKFINAGKPGDFHRDRGRVKGY